ncbi:MAG: glycosyltransferase family 4 protein [Phycisphaera sp. RhM]|nr:glycosyltransferase family 4 protein [Phycisphaera sp. RhM]
MRLPAEGDDSGVVLSHPTGNANSRGVLGGLLASDQLAAFHTTIATFDRGIWAQLGKTRLGRDFGRRRFDEAAKPRTHQRPSRELARMVAGRLGLGFLTRHETSLCSVDAVYRDLDRHVARRIGRSQFRAVYSYEDGALKTFRTAKSLGIKCLYDLPIGYWKSARKLLETERERWPEWESTMPGFRDSDEKLACKDGELQLADRIYVASRFTKQTLSEFDGPLAPVEVIPYGFPDPGPERSFEDIHHRPLKLLFVGGLSQRKGIADVFAIADQLGDAVDLTVVGRSAVQSCNVLNDALGRHRWIPSLPHDDVLRLMRENDVLLFPSLFEGFGLVITEAMSQGTPVITTDRTAGPDVITSGEDGWIIPAGNTPALRSAVENILDDPDQIARISENGRQTAMRRPWETYGKTLAVSIKTYLETQVDGR